MPYDKPINTSVGCLASYALWAIVFFFMGTGTVLESFTLQNWGLVTSAGAATVTIRQYFVRQNRIMQNAFKLARGTAATPTPTPIRPR